MRIGVIKAGFCVSVDEVSFACTQNSATMEDGLVNQTGSRTSSPQMERSKKDSKLKSVFLVAAAVSRLSKKPVKRPSSLDLSGCSTLNRYDTDRAPFTFKLHVYVYAYPSLVRYARTGINIRFHSR